MYKCRFVYVCVYACLMKYVNINGSRQSEAISRLTKLVIIYYTLISLKLE